MDAFKIIIVEDVKLELKGTEEIIRTELPEAEVIGTAMNEAGFWALIKEKVPDLLLLDLGLGGSTTVGVDICRKVRKAYPELRILIFTGEILNESPQSLSVIYPLPYMILISGFSGMTMLVFSRFFTDTTPLTNGCF